MKIQCILFLISIFLTPLVYANDIYYVDKVNGNDNNSGKNKAAAWKSLNKLNSFTFKPDDQIYLKRGQIFSGSVYLKGSGVNGGSIRLSSFGSGKRPVINAGNNEYAIKLLDGEYWEIENIETTGGKNAGIFIGCTKENLVLNHFRITNCYVHDIGDTTKIDWDYSKSTGGLIVVNGAFDSSGKPVFYNSVINDVIIMMKLATKADSEQNAESLCVVLTIEISIIYLEEESWIILS